VTEHKRVLPLEASQLVVLIVAYGAPDSLAACLGSLERRYPVVVIDNSSSPAVAQVAEQGGARYLDARSNLGFASGVNLGLTEVMAMNADVLLLNPDAMVVPSTVEELQRALHASPSVACVAPAQHPPQSHRLDRVCWPFPTPRRAWREAMGLGRLDDRCDYLIGSVLLLRHGALMDVGGLDQRFFMYAEEVDWQRRATRLGWEIAYCPELVALHVGAGTDDDRERRELRFHSGVERYVRKWHGTIGWFSFRVANVAGAALRALLLSGSRRRAARRRARLYLIGPDKAARRAGAVPPPVPRIPCFSGRST
jgi:GT2 family glycosyltransferase